MSDLSRYSDQSGHRPAAVLRTCVLIGTRLMYVTAWIASLVRLPFLEAFGKPIEGGEVHASPLPTKVLEAERDVADRFNDIAVAYAPNLATNQKRQGRIRYVR